MLERLQDERVVAIVVTYNRKELLDECLTAMLNQTFPIDRIIVINNHSTDGTEELFKEGGKFFKDTIELHTMEKNLGGSGGFRKGFEIADSYDFDWLWIMDDDAIAEPNTLEELIKAKRHLKDEKIGFLASSVYGPNKESMNVPVIDHKRSGNGYEDWYRNLEYGLVKLRSATFVSLLIPHDAIKQLGYPIHDYFIWGDDTEYTTRLSRYYGNCYFCGNSKILHKRGNAKRLLILTEEDKKRIDLYYYLYRNSLITAKKYNPPGNSALHVGEFHLLALKCLLKPNVKHRWKKFLTVEKAIQSYLFGSNELKSKVNNIPKEKP